jgi:hypothetical protein
MPYVSRSRSVELARDIREVTGDDDRDAKICREVPVLSNEVPLHQTEEMTPWSKVRRTEKR